MMERLHLPAGPWCKPEEMAMAREVWATCLGCWPWMDGWMVSLFSLLCYVLLNFAACLLYFILFSVFCQAL